MNNILQIIIAALASSGLFSFITFLIQRKDKRTDKRLDVLERDGCRTQMLIMLNHYPDDTTEIMKLAEHYFRDLKGDWYMTSIFNKWLERNKLGKPEWFNAED